MDELRPRDARVAAHDDVAIHQAQRVIASMSDALDGRWPSIHQEALRPEFNESSCENMEIRTRTLMLCSAIRRLPPEAIVFKRSWITILSGFPDKMSDVFVRAVVG